MSQLFSLNNLLTASAGPWALNRYDDDGDPDPIGNYEAVIATVGDQGLFPYSITYIDNSSNQSKTVLEANTPPTISDIADQTINEDGNTGAISFTVGDTETLVGSLVVTAASSDTTKVPLGNIALGGSGASRTVTVTSAANKNGQVTITLTVTDGSGLTDSDSFVLTVNPVNDPPSFTPGSNVTVNEDSGAYSAGWATNISKGPSDESSQTLTFEIVGIDNSSLFSSGPAISPAGALTFTPGSNKNGVANLIVRLKDNGGGNDTSGTESLRITINPINDSPTLTTVSDLSGASKNTPFAISYAMLAAAADESDVDGDPMSFRISSLSSGTLTKNGAPASTGDSGSLLGSGESLLWTPAIDATGELNAFSVKAWDGQAHSPAMVQVKVNVSVDIPPEIEVWGGGMPIENNDSTPSLNDLTDIGAWDIEGTSVRYRFYIFNVGDGILVLTGDPRVTITGPNASDFSVSEQPIAAVTPDVRVTYFDLVFDPSFTGARRAFINVANNDPDENPYTFAIKGTGIGLPGDYNRNGDVEATDYDLWKSLYGTMLYPGSSADGNKNGIVDAADYTVWRDNLGASVFEFQAPALVGDYNGNRIVDAADYTVWRDTLNSTVIRYSAADGNGDGSVDQLDYDVWKTNFGQTFAPQGSGALASVPASTVTPQRVEQSGSTQQLAADPHDETSNVPAEMNTIASDLQIVTAAPIRSPGGTLVNKRGQSMSHMRLGTAIRQDAGLLAWLSTYPRRQLNGNFNLTSDHDDCLVDRSELYHDLAYSILDEFRLPLSRIGTKSRVAIA